MNVSSLIKKNSETLVIQNFIKRMAHISLSPKKFSVTANSSA